MAKNRGSNGKQHTVQVESHQYILLRKAPRAKSVSMSAHISTLSITLEAAAILPRNRKGKAAVESYYKILHSQ